MRLRGYKITGHQPPHVEPHALTAWGVKRLEKKTTALAEPPTVNRNGDSCAAGVAKILSLVA